MTDVNSSLTHSSLVVPSNTIVMAGRLTGAVDAALMSSAFRDVVRGHTGHPDVLSGLGTADLHGLLPTLDLRWLGEAERDESVTELLGLEPLRPWNLENEAPLRARLLLVPDGAILILAAHRGTVDESLLGTIAGELIPVYEALAAGHGLPGPAANGLPRAAAHDGTARAAAPAPSARRSSLPADRVRFSAPSGVASTVPLAIGDDLAEEIHALARSLHCAAETVLAAALAALLVRLGTAEEVTLAFTSMSFRPGSRDRTLPIRADLTEDPNFHDLLRRVHKTRTSAPDRGSGSGSGSGSARPLPPVALTVHDRPMFRTRGTVAVTPVPLPRVGSPFELRVVLEPEPEGGYRGRLEYDADLFERATAVRFAARYPLLLAAAVAEPHRPVSELPILTAAERLLVLEEWNPAEPCPPQERCVHELIADRARIAPGLPAVLHGGETLTYGDLERRANRLARELVARGARPGHLVGLCARRSADVVVGLVAVLKTGAAYVPLDPAYPAAQLEFMFSDSGARLLLVDDVSTPLPEGGPAEAVRLSAFSEPGRDPGPPVTAATPDSLCYVIYTSGSTGRPKGAANTHRGVLTTLRALAGRLWLGTTSRLLQTSSLNFDMSSFDIVTTLISGGCLVVPEPHESGDPALLLDLAHRADVTVWSSAPALFRSALEVAYTEGVGLPPRLQTVALGGDRFPPTVPTLLADLAPEARVFNFAGMTEVSFTTTAHPVTVADLTRPTVPWGRPLPGQRMYVLDPYGEPVPPGAPGELYIGGAGVGRGYWNRPGLTAERFLPDPFVPDPSATMYRTGDRVRHLPDGAVEFLGRLDHQVKVRGYRVETGEVEASLSRHPRVVTAAVEARGGAADGDRRLVAHVVFAAPGPPPAVDDLRDFLSDSLPKHMIPSVFLARSALPLTPGGKIDRRALASVTIPAERPRLAAPYEAPRDDLERSIIAEWCLLLEVEGIGVHDDFAALGGTSLLATAVMTMLSDTLGVRLSARDLLEAPTPALMAERVRALRRTAPPRSA